MGSPSEAFGPYLVYEQLGIGGMASVHRAEVAGIEGFTRPVALKRMLPHVAADAEMVAAFVREAHLASHLRHGNVAQTYDLGKVGDIYYIAMEMISGKSLREILKHCAATTGPMPVSVALNILNQMCDALDYAHNLCDETGKLLGIIHRDVSPSNIIVAHDGVVKLIDFGIAKVTSSSMQTMTGTIKGKFGYMAPEYIAGSIDARADLFALGVIAHELLTNRPLFTGPDDMETLHRVRRMDIHPPSKRNPQVPPEVDDIVMTALSRDPDRRWQQATALRTAMTTVTRRLGLEISNAQVVDWVNWAFQQRGPVLPPGSTIMLTDDDPSIVVAGATSQLSTDEAGSTSDQLTRMLAKAATMSPDTPMPVGTPNRITAQNPHQTLPTTPDLAAYREAVASYEREEAVPTLVRAPTPIAPGGRTSGLRQAVPGAEPARRPSTPSQAATLAGVPASSPGIRIPTTPDPTRRPITMDPPLQRGSAPNVIVRNTPQTMDPPNRASAPNLRQPASSTPPPNVARTVTPQSRTIIDPALGGPAVARTATPNNPPIALQHARLPVAEPVMVPTPIRNMPLPVTPPAREARTSDPPFAHGSMDPAFAQTGSRPRLDAPPPGPASATAPVARSGGSALTLILVLIAAAVAAAAVYFVLPLLT